MLEEAQRKLEDEVKGYKCELNDPKDTFSHEQDKIKHDLGAMIEQLSSSVEIGYNLAMDSLKKKSKKKSLAQYYYQILNIPTMLHYSLTQTQAEGDDQGENFEASDGESEVGDEQARDGAGDPQLFSSPFIFEKA